MSFEIYLIIYCICCVVINTAYEGSLKSHLTVTKEPKPIKTLTEMATQTSGDIVFVNKELHDFEKILRDSPFKKMNTLIEDRNVRARTVEYSEVHKEALHGNIVVNSEFFLKFAIRQQLSYNDGTTDMQIVPQWFVYYYYVFQMPRMGRFSGLIDKRVFQLRESGHVGELLKRVVDNEVPVPLDGEHTEVDGGFTSKPLNLDVFLLLFIGYAFGVALAQIALILENYAINL